LRENRGVRSRQPRRRRERRAERRWIAFALALASTVLACGVGAGASYADTETVGLGGWQVLSSALVPQTGRQISEPAFPTGSWLKVTPDGGGAPGTEIAALLQNGACPGVFFSEAMRGCFGYMERIGADTVPTFAVPWWYRTDFEAPAAVGSHEELIVNGVVGAAAVWVDGHRLASRSTVQGAFTRYTFDVTKLVHAGVNSLALEVYPNNPSTMLTLDDVDWNQIPPDNNTGVEFPVQLHMSDGLAISGVHVVQNDSADLSTAALTLKAEVSNETAAVQSGTVSATVTPPAGDGTPIALSQAVSVAPGHTVAVSFDPAEDPSLTIEHPQVWWPYPMGAQPLYGLTMSVAGASGEPDAESESFGIRTVTSELIGPSAMAPAGVRRFAVNGQPLVIRGGGWAQDLFLRYSASNVAQQIALIKNLGLNAIRTEGKQMPQDFYEQMDRAGILIDAGFQCCDAWQPEGRKLSRHELETMQLSARTIGEQLRDHPSVLDFSWSDNAPTPAQERVSLKGFEEADFPDPLVSSAEYNSSRVLGPAGEKEGPYDWVPPTYWYDDTHFDASDPTRTNVGGAWGFDSEASAGDTVATEPSLERFMSSVELSALWREPAFNQYHTNYEPEVPGPKNEGYSFGTLYELDQAIWGRYGAPANLQQYVEEAQLQNYETQRAEFEAYVDHAHQLPTPSTGIIYWQLNKGWPTLLWDLYNEEFDEAGSYFGAMEANRPLHALLAYDNDTVTVDNLTGQAASGLSVQARVYSLGGTLLDDQTAPGLTVGAQGVLTGVLTPKLPAATSPPETPSSYFVQLILRRGGEVVDRNTYWLSTQPDAIEWKQTEGNTHAVMSQYANLRELRELPAANLSVVASTHRAPGPAGADMQTTVTLTNTSSRPTVALFLRTDLRRGSAAGVPAAGDSEVLPTFWSANDTTIWPGESETETVAYDSTALMGESPVVSVAGWNLAPTDVAAPPE
jgi:exo-1,4-beta-D-glucosaminidase